MDRVVNKIYKFYSDDEPNTELCRLTIKESLHDESGDIQIFDFDKAPVLAILAYRKQNNITGVKVVLDSRVMPANRIGFADFCKTKGLNPDSIDDKLTICDGRTLSDDYFVKVEKIYE